MEIVNQNKLSLYKKISKVTSEVGKLQKSLENPFHKSRYFDINLLIEHVTPLLNSNGLLLMQPIINGEVVSRIIDLETMEVDESCLEIPKGLSPQNVGSAISYYRRYTLQSQLGIQAEDDDANKTLPKTNTGNNQSDQTKKPWINPGQEKWLVAVDLLRTGKKSINGIKKFYNISKDNEPKLIEESKLPAVEPKAKSKLKLDPSSAKWQDAIAFLKGTGTMEFVKQTYELSKENEELLKNAIL